jgi:hypothetical protein
MEPEGSLPCSQEPSTVPYPEPDRSSPYHPILSEIYFNKEVFNYSIINKVYKFPLDTTFQ